MELEKSIERSSELQRAFTTAVEENQNLMRDYEVAQEELRLLRIGGGEAQRTSESVRKLSTRGDEEDRTQRSTSPLTRRDYFNYSSAKESFRRDQPVRERDREQPSSPMLGVSGLSGGRTNSRNVFSTFDVRSDAFARDAHHGSLLSMRSEA